MIKTIITVLMTMSATAAFAQGDAAAGEKAFKKCAACHTVNEGGKNSAGPNLYGITVRGVGVVDYKYSKGFPEFAAANPQWTNELLDAWLTDPKAVIKGTKMAIKVSKEQERADLIAYLNSLGSQ